MTLFRVEVIGNKEDAHCRLKMEMVDPYDDVLSFTSRARTTAFTAAILSRMIARGEIEAKGMLTAEQVITGPLLARLLEGWAQENMRFEETTELV